MMTTQATPWWQRVVLAIHDIDAEMGGVNDPKTPPEIEEIYTHAGQLQQSKGATH
jgi:hypothetical protein